VLQSTQTFLSADDSTKRLVGVVLREWRKRQIDLVVSTSQFAELTEVLRSERIRVKYKINESRADNLLRRLARTVVPDGPTDVRFTVRDRKDAVILFTAIEQGVDCLVSGDQDLLVIANAAAEIGLSIVTPRQFAETFGLERTK
jgi:putative PIN family toxin of toxin-antitoxin system